MGGRVDFSRVTVRCPDGRPDRADRGGRCTLVGALREVGRDGRRIRRQGGVAVRRRPFRPALPRRAVLRPSAWRAAIEECLVDARPVGVAQFDGERYGQRYHGAAGLRCGIYYHQL